MIAEPSTPMDAYLKRWRIAAAFACGPQPNDGLIGRHFSPGVSAMAVETSYPGVYVEEVPTGIRPIEGVSTSTTAFVGPARSGPIDGPAHVQSYRDYVQ